MHDILRLFMYLSSYRIVVNQIHTTGPPRPTPNPKGYAILIGDSEVYGGSEIPKKMQSGPAIRTRPATGPAIQPSNPEEASLSLAAHGGVQMARWRLQQ